MQRTAKRNKLQKLQIGNTYPLTINEILDRWDLKSLIGYVNNRGGRLLNKALVREIANNLHLPSLLPIPVGEVRKGAQQFFYADCHTQWAGVKLRRDEGNLSPNEGNYIVPVTVMTKDEALDVYVNRNNHNAHNARARLSNPDFAFAREIDRLFKLANLNLPDSLNSKIRPQIASIMAAYRFNKLDSYRTAFQCKSIVMKSTKKEPRIDMLKFKTVDRDPFQQALEYYKELRKLIHRRFGVNKKTGKPLVDDAVPVTFGASFAGFLTYDGVSNKYLTSLSVTELAKRIIKKIHKVAEIASNLTKHPDTAPDKLIKLLRPKLDI